MSRIIWILIRIDNYSLSLPNRVAEGHTEFTCPFDCSFVFVSSTLCTMIKFQVWILKFKGTGMGLLAIFFYFDSVCKYYLIIQWYMRQSLLYVIGREILKFLVDMIQYIFLIQPVINLQEWNISFLVKFCPAWQQFKGIFITTYFPIDVYAHIYMRS